MTAKESRAIRRSSTFPSFKASKIQISLMSISKLRTSGCPALSRIAHVNLLTPNSPRASAATLSSSRTSLSWLRDHKTTTRQPTTRPSHLLSATATVLRTIPCDHRCRMVCHHATLWEPGPDSRMAPHHITLTWKDYTRNIWKTECGIVTRPRGWACIWLSRRRSWTVRRTWSDFTLLRRFLKRSYQAKRAVVDTL